jgi:hypothetical protein
MEGMYSLRPEHIRLNEGGEVQVQGVVQAVQYQGRLRGLNSNSPMARNCW